MEEQTNSNVGRHESSEEEFIHTSVKTQIHCLVRVVILEYGYELVPTRVKSVKTDHFRSKGSSVLYYTYCDIFDGYAHHCEILMNNSEKDLSDEFTSRLLISSSIIPTVFISSSFRNLERIALHVVEKNLFLHYITKLKKHTKAFKRKTQIRVDLLNEDISKALVNYKKSVLPISPMLLSLSYIRVSHTPSRNFLKYYLKQHRLRCENLESIIIEQCEYTDKDAIGILNILLTYKTVKHISFRNNNILGSTAGKEGSIPHFISAITKLGVKHLDLSCNLLKWESLRALSKYVGSKNCLLTTLNFESNLVEFGAPKFDALCKQIPNIDDRANNMQILLSANFMTGLSKNKIIDLAVYDLISHLGNLKFSDLADLQRRHLSVANNNAQDEKFYLKRNVANDKGYLIMVTDKKAARVNLTAEFFSILKKYCTAIDYFYGGMFDSENSPIFPGLISLLETKSYLKSYSYNSLVMASVYKKILSEIQQNFYTKCMAGKPDKMVCKYLLARHPIFKSRSDAEFLSILDDQFKVSRDAWIVYVAANLPESEERGINFWHMSLFIECLDNSGQKKIVRIHLHSHKGRGATITFDSISGDELLKSANEFKKNFEYCALIGKSSNVNSLIQEARNRCYNEDEYRYRLYGPISTKPRRSQTVHNCTSWVRRMLAKHLNVDVPNVPFNHPKAFVNLLKKK